jgi:O-antigen ligase
MWWLPDGVKYLPGLVVLALLAYCANRSWHFKDIEILERQRAFLWIFWLWIAYSLFIFFWMEDSWTEVRGYLATALYVSVIAGMRVSLRPFIGLLSICAIGLVSLSFWQYLEGIDRIHGFINANTYAVVVGSLSILIVSLATCAKSYRISVSLFVLAALLAIALFMTGSRGVTISFGLTSILLYVYLVKKSKQKMLVSLSGVVLFSCFLMPAVWWFMQDRIAFAIEEIHALDESNSIGLRLQMWQVAMKVIPHSPMFGVGEGHYAIVQDLYENGMVSERLHAFHLDHFHNQIIDYAVKKGLVGVVLFVALIGSGVYVVWKNARFEYGKVTILALVSFFGFSSVASVPFHHPEATFLFFVMVSTLSAISEMPENSMVEAIDD